MARLTKPIARRRTTTRFRLFGSTDLPIELPAAESDAPKGQAPIGTMTTRALWQRSQNHKGGRALGGVGVSSPLALPTACLVLALVGIHWSIRQKGREIKRFCRHHHPRVAYYSISLVGVSLAKEGRAAGHARSVARRLAVSGRRHGSCSTGWRATVDMGASATPMGAIARASAASRSALGSARDSVQCI